MVRLSGKPMALLTRLPPALSRTIMENASLGKAPLWELRAGSSYFCLRELGSVL